MLASYRLTGFICVKHNNPAPHLPPSASESTACSLGTLLPPPSSSTASTSLADSLLRNSSLVKGACSRCRYSLLGQHKQADVANDVAPRLVLQVSLLILLWSPLPPFTDALLLNTKPVTTKQQHSPLLVSEGSCKLLKASSAYAAAEYIPLCNKRATCKAQRQVDYHKVRVLTAARSQNGPASFSKSSLLILLWKSFPPCNSSTRMGAAVLADRISFVRRTWRRNLAIDLGTSLHRHAE